MLLFTGFLFPARAQDFSAYQNMEFSRNGVIFLHGSGQRENDNTSQLIHGAGVNADVKYTEYPGVKHNSWNNAFTEPGLMEWLFSKQRNTDQTYATR